MSDLTSRLRIMAQTGWNPIGEEAADEIDRLTKENNILKNSMDGADFTLAEFVKENEQLRAKLATIERETAEKVVFQCCYCKLPKLSPEDQKKASHGYHETCIMVDQPKFYRETLSKLLEGECVT